MPCSRPTLRYFPSVIHSKWRLKAGVGRLRSVAIAGSVEQILRVDHAGERGAICIYQSQLAVARVIYPSCVEQLAEMLSHEIDHFYRFDAILKERGIRQCHALAFWALGGWALGIITALCGQRGIWVCTAAVENTVNAHLEHQVEFLKGCDSEAFEAVQAIRSDEEAHEQHANERLGNAVGPYKLLWWFVAGSTSFAIWLSTRL